MLHSQIRELQLSVSQPLGFLLFETVSAITALGTALYFSWNLTLVIIATFPLAGGILYLISRKLTPAIEAQKRELTEASKLANTAVTAIETVKAFNGQDQEVWQYLSAIKRSTAYYMVQARASALQFGITKFIMVAIFVQGFWYGISLVDHGLSAGRVLTTFYACMMGMQALEIVLPQWLVLAKGMSAGATLKSIKDEVDRGKNVSKVEGSLKLASCDGDIEVNEVRLRMIDFPNRVNMSR
jgi:ATP-binding cassette subfamily B (MDR/TAP) protein 1